VEGEGPPLIVFANFMESFTTNYLLPGRADVLRRMSGGRRLVFMDLHGTGLSDRRIGDFSLESFVRDVRAVVRALGGDRVALMGSQVGGMTAIDYAARHPDEVDRLILHTTFARVSDVFPPGALKSLAALARTNWDLAIRTLADLGARREGEDEGLAEAERIRRSVDPEFVAGLLENDGEYVLDKTELLGRISAPTLVLHPVDDPIYPLALGQRLASGIPNARLLPLQQAAYSYAAMPDDVITTVNAFLNEGLAAVSTAPAGKAAQGPFRAVLVSDLAGSTEMMSRLGDEAGRQVLREHERITREVLKAHRGAEIKTMGDGFMASFASVTQAVECAIALQRAFAERNESAAEPLNVRVGLNAGEPIEEEGDLFGASVIVASRIAAEAEGGEVLASLAVRELCAGKGFLFADRGDHALRGFEDPLRVFEVAWRR
jgi:class 3 adenylate cyclase/pimeloyl-ACP methyl ester carboxylesterase